MSKYKDLNQDELEKLQSNYLIDSWSYSKVMAFARNEKAFEMRYIYCTPGRVSSTTIAGQAYHYALDMYFSNMKEGIETDIIDLELAAFNYIDEIPAYVWKIQKTTPTVADCIQNAIKTTSQLLNNFMGEVQIYEYQIKQVVGSEVKINQWLTINGVDIPIPCVLKIDLIVTTKEGKRVIIDHKSRKSFSDEKEIKFTAAKQAITYTLGYEAETGEKIDEFWFIENKYSQNRDGSKQLMPFKIKLDDNTRRLYEAMLYEPLKRMVEAVGDPDYVYLINENDNLTDKAEIHEFWARTMLAEVDDFNIPENKKPLIRERLRKIRDASLATVNPTVIKNFKKFSEQFIPYDLTNKDMTDQEKIEHVLRSFGIVSKVQHTFNGYSSVTFLLELNAGVPLTSIFKHKLDIANVLNVSNVRIQKDLFVYHGKSYLAIEFGKKRTEDLFWDDSRSGGMRIPLGLDNFQQEVVWDLDNHSTPHMLVCGATGSGKSVFLRSTIEYSRLAGITTIYIFDPKFEFINEYKGVPGIEVISGIEDIEHQMMLLVKEMEQKVRSGNSGKTLIIFDEFADAVANSRKGNDLKNYSLEIVGSYKNGAPKTKRVHTSTDKSLEENLRILLQKGRSTGFRIIAATQRASTKVITGDAKVNFPVQVCFRVPKDVDSMVVLDEPGAESLNGRGDGLIKSPEYLNVVRFQAFYKVSKELVA